jgi:hypothetical protein
VDAWYLKAISLLLKYFPEKQSEAGYEGRFIIRGIFQRVGKDARNFSDRIKEEKFLRLCHCFLQ